MLSMDKTIAIRIDPALHKRISIRRVENGLSLKEYIVGLVANDLKDSKPLTFESASVDIISEKSIDEAQKVLDFVRNIITDKEVS